jgi:hypothetical protein
VGTSYADSVAVTGQPTSITSTSATLNGIINAGTADVGWTFQYGTSIPSVQNTGVHTAKQVGVYAVSTTIHGLSPGTTYQFRLVGVQQVDTTLGPQFHPGDNVEFTTTKFGKTKLAHRRLKVKGGMVSVPFQCVGAKGVSCKGKISLSTTEKVGKTHRTVSCGKASFAGSGGHTKTVRAKVGGKCAGLLSTSHKRSISATLKATFSTHQGALKTGVTLFE